MPDDNDEYNTNSHHYVYIPDEEQAWLPCQVVKSNESSDVLQVAILAPHHALASPGKKPKKKKVKPVLKEIPKLTPRLLQNVNEHGVLNVVEDMVDLPFLHEAAILYNLKARHQQAQPYTRTGDIVIAVNPYQWFTKLYSPVTQRRYTEALVGCDPQQGDPRRDLAPHIYETSALAYRGLAMEGEDQSILVSGESGAGKTESVKICLQHIASMTSRQSNHDICQRVLDSNPLLEAFGNAKTRRNDNSSRFGKYIHLEFDNEQDGLDAAFVGMALPDCPLAGSVSQVYLLEKSRVVRHAPDERTYHIFYQLLAADDERKASIWSGLADTDNESFAYVGYTDTHAIEGKTDQDRFEETIQSLAMVGVKDDKLQTLLRAICIVLQLGNIVFSQDPNNDDMTVMEPFDDVKALAELMGVSLQVVKEALTIRTMRTRTEVYKVPLNAAQAKDSCDAFAKEIYHKTFLWLVRQINDATSAEKNYPIANKNKRFGIIGLLDIFGFESFDCNRFEQLCINYANEKLQQKFTQDIFRSVQHEYEEEGIELDEIRYDDNTDVLDLVEGPMGLLAVLNEECVRPGGSDKSFVAKISAMNKDNSIFIRDDTFGPFNFGIKHYAGEVLYEATEIVVKNTDTLPLDFVACAKQSSNLILAQELSNENMTSSDAAPTTKKKKKRPMASKKPARSHQNQSNLLVQQTVWTKFKGQLSSLMTSLCESRTRYIRCIKPNTEKAPLEMEHMTTIDQLRCAGVVAAVTISRSAFPNRVEHEIILDRFKSLWTYDAHQRAIAVSEKEEDEDRQVFILIDALLTPALKEFEMDLDGRFAKGFVIGSTRTYFRAGTLEHLEAERLRRLGEWAIRIQSVYRGSVLRKQFAKLKVGSVAFQAVVRKVIWQGRFRKARAASIVIECWYRCANASHTLVALRRKFRATKIQSLWRMILQRERFRRLRVAAIVVQTQIRGAIQRPKFRVALHERREEAKLENQLVALQRKLEDAERARVNAEKAAEDKARRAIEAHEEEMKARDKERLETERAEAERKKQEEEKAKEAELSSVDETEPSVKTAPPPETPVKTIDEKQLAEQMVLIDESGRMLEYLRKEVFKLRGLNNQLQRDLDLLKDNNQRLMDANASAGASFAALNQHAKQLTRANEKLQAEHQNHKAELHKMNVLQMELKDELKMKKATYVAEVHSRLQYQKAMSKIVDFVQDRSRDRKLVESVLRVADECESASMMTADDADVSRFVTPPRSPANVDGEESAGLMSSLRSLWA